MTTSRMPQHISETNSRAIFQLKISRFKNEYVSEGDLLFRELSEKDYGIDGILEVFKNGEPTGIVALIQLKSTEKLIKPLKKHNVISCSGITKSNIAYCNNSVIPIILIYVSTANEEFYFIDLTDFTKNEKYNKNNDSITVRIPLENNSTNLKHLIDIILDYYDEDYSSNDDDMLEPKTSEIINQYDRAANGFHKQINCLREVIREGEWLNEELNIGTEYEVLIQVTQGSLIYKANCPEDPYDATNDFDYVKFESYREEPFFRFQMSMPYLQAERWESFYIADIKVLGNMEKLENISTIQDFLEKKDPRLLLRIKEFRKYNA